MIGKHQLIIAGGLFFSPLLLSAQPYFQQQVDHRIHVRLDDDRHFLHAYQEFTYTNNSPDRLDTLWMHIWPNAYRDRSSALSRQMVRMGDLDLHFATEEERGWIDSLDFRTNDIPLKWAEHPDHGDVAWIALDRSLEPGGSITITTPFRVKIPSSKFSRLGHTGQAYHITQWYPKPAVYDENGWHAMPYLTQGEFFSEFGSFDVSITLSKNYVVGATGILQNEEEKAFLDRLAQLSIDSADNAFPPSDPDRKTLRFVQDSIHDFAWFADKRFIVRKGNVTLPRSGRSIDTWTMFTPKNAALWENSIDYVNESLRLYSEWIGDYPYAHCTAIDGTISAGGGMEYPMITIIGNMGSKESLDNVIAHEVGHNWFYGILASNERDHPWMDEGINSFYELRYMRERYPAGGFALQLPFLKRIADEVKDGHHFEKEMMYRFNARRNLDQPADLHSTDYTMINYGTIVYGKAALAFDHLFAYLGAETFDRGMQRYFDQWRFKHPDPKDLRAILEEESGKDLGWFFGELIGSDRKFDVKAIKLQVAESDQRPRLRIKTSGIENVPIPVTGYAGDDSLGTIWTIVEPKWINSTTELPWFNADVICIDHGQRTLDIDRRNNQVASSGLFRRWTAPRLGFLTGIERHDRSSVYWTPLIARNEHDGWQLGIGLHNYHFPSQHTEWIVAPLYGFNSEAVIGGARLEHHFDRLRIPIVRNIHLALNVRSASTFTNDQLHRRYSKLSPSVRFDLRRDPLSRPWEHQLTLRTVHLRHDATFTNMEGSEYNYHATDHYAEISHTAMDRSALLPTLIRPAITAGERFVRGSLELQQGITYNKKKDQLRLRLFAGSFLWKSDAFLDRTEVWRLSWGPEDMLFDHAYLARGPFDTDVHGRQFQKQQGAFKTPFAQGRSDDWIAAFNMELDLPLPIPISLFSSWGMVPSRLTIHSNGTTEVRNTISKYYEAGVGLQLIRDVMEVWFPLVVSDRIADEEEFQQRQVSDRIRFVIDFAHFDPTRVLRNLRP